MVATVMTNPCWQVRFNCSFVQRNALMSLKKVALYFNLDCHFKRMDSKNEVSIVQCSSEKSTKRKTKKKTDGIVYRY